MLPASETFQHPLALARAQIPSTAISSRNKAIVRMLRRIRALGIALRRMIRSRSVAAETLWGTERGQSHRPQPMLAAPAREPVTHFESALGYAGADPPELHHLLGRRSGTGSGTLNYEKTIIATAATAPE